MTILTSVHCVHLPFFCSSEIKRLIKVIWDGTLFLLMMVLVKSILYFCLMLCGGCICCCLVDLPFSWCRVLLFLSLCMCRSLVGCYCLVLFVLCYFVLFVVDFFFFLFLILMLLLLFLWGFLRRYFVLLSFLSFFFLIFFFFSFFEGEGYVCAHALGLFVCFDCFYL